MLPLLKLLAHYGLHLVAPYFLAALWPKRSRLRVYLLLLATMAIDLDHLLVRPIFDPERCSVGFHLLHSWPFVLLYALLCVLPYGRLGWPWWLRVLGVGLCLHIFTDWQDFVLWRLLDGRLSL
ncbi:DUF6122 family protein [uncultured Porphyromonas sp.]|uniref:DUF6122 family protein n=1 Tax=uncultured Porphyromonas sp. TaxID=159274 RepID=UPI00262B37FA|nr:DUF6122 family protein [uncultured Porphyromonas sp.]